MARSGEIGSKQFSCRLTTQDRLFEAVIIVIGLVSLLSLLTLSREFASGASLDASSLQVSSTLFRAIHTWTFIIGVNFMLGINTLMCSYLLYQTKLVHRFIAFMGLTGATLVFIAALLEMFGVILQISVWAAILALPIFAYEMTLAVWLIVKGFNLPATASESAKTAMSEV